MVVFDPAIFQTFTITTDRMTTATTTSTANVKRALLPWRCGAMTRGTGALMLEPQRAQKLLPEGFRMPQPGHTLTGVGSNLGTRGIAPHMGQYL